MKGFFKMIKYFIFLLLFTSLQGAIFVVSGPAGSGKTTLVERLRSEFPEVEQSISYTTRTPRPGEIDGVHYNFISTQQFERMLAEGDFLEHIKLYDRYYGTSKSKLNELQSKGRHVILILDTAGRPNVEGILDATFIFIKPPAPEIDTLKQRLIGRNSDTADVIEKRLQRASKELEDGERYEYQIINDDLDKAYEVFKNIFVEKTDPQNSSVINRKEFRQNTMGDETNNTLRSTLLLPSQVDEYVFNLGGKDFYQVFFDMDLKKALELGYKISIKSFFEFTGSLAMKYTATYVKEILNAEFGEKDHVTMVDLFTGTGQAAFGFAKAGFCVTAIELDETTFQCAKENLRLSGVTNTKVLHKNALDFLDEVAAKGDKFSVMFLDPPWNGKYMYDLRTPFLLEYTQPYAKDLICQSLELAPIVVLKAPQNISKKQIHALGDALCCRTHIQYQKMPQYPDELNHAVVYFIKEGEKRSTIRHSSEVVNL